jgi:hypothetical protein
MMRTLMAIANHVQQGYRSYLEKWFFFVTIDLPEKDMAEPESEFQMRLFVLMVQNASAHLMDYRI